ncbi:hypothetical protein HK097_010078 [Rhizophlyctis rosea]|uniref:Uncharacterized protein n=1 Tax=Rhizophlyctis rosea TaxID=64517 RepID=A0AAD5SBA0_9FUNG|nr:hypothetical protein HK097_010078 [Rhizophlyctis rosea]
MLSSGQMEYCESPQSHAPTTSLPAPPLTNIATPTFTKRSSNARLSTLSCQSVDSVLSNSSSDVVYVDSRSGIPHDTANGIEYRAMDSVAPLPFGTFTGPPPVFESANVVALMMTKRRNIAVEILESEVRYVDSLVLLRELYLEPLSKAAGTSAEILPRKLVTAMFSELVGIINVNQELRKQLASRVGPDWSPETGQIGDIFLTLTPYLKMYSSYIKNFNSALALTEDQAAKNSQFSSFLQVNVNAIVSQPSYLLISFEDSLGKYGVQGLDLPVISDHARSENTKIQAFTGCERSSDHFVDTKHILLTFSPAQDLLKHTPRSHPDHEDLVGSLEMISRVANFVNETVRHHEMTWQLIEIQRSLVGLSENVVVPGRRLIKRGRVQKICRKNHQNRYLILLSDVLIYASSGLLDDQYVFHRKLHLELCRVIDVPDTQNLRNIFQIISSEKSFAMYADTPYEKQEWIRALNGAISELLANQSTLDEERGENKHVTMKKRKMNDYRAPIWVPDEFALKCMICEHDFSLFNRKHHCRACGKVVCGACSSRVGLPVVLLMSSHMLTQSGAIVQYFVVPGIEEDTAARACDPCHERIAREGKLRIVDGNYDPEASDMMSSDLPSPNEVREEPETSLPVVMSPGSKAWGMGIEVKPQIMKIIGGIGGAGRGVKRKAPDDEAPPTPSFCSLCKEGFTLLNWKVRNGAPKVLSGPLSDHFA